MGFAAAAGALLALAPDAARACAVCFAGQEEEGRVAYMIATLLLSVLPLALIGGLVLWLVRRAAELRAESESESPPRGSA